MKTKTITHQQARTLEIVERFIAEHGYPPTIREVSAVFRFGPFGAASHLMALERKGRIQRSGGGRKTQSRALKVLRPLTAEERRANRFPPTAQTTRGVFIPAQKCMACGNVTIGVPCAHDYSQEEETYVLVKRAVNS